VPQQEQVPLVAPGMLSSRNISKNKSGTKMDVVNTLKQLADGGIALILLSIIVGLGWYILKVREPYERSLETAINGISSALQELTETNRATLDYLQTHTTYMQSDLGAKLSEIKGSQAAIKQDLQNLAGRVDLLIVSSGKFANGQS
jgi:hypothetical protein